MKRSKLYNVIFPLWFAFFMPPLVFITLIGNLVIDGLVIYLTLKLSKVLVPNDILKKIILKAWGLGFVADILGAGLIFLSSEYFNLNFYRIWDNGTEFIIVSGVILLIGLVIGLFNYIICRKASLSGEISRRVALSMGIITAPWMFLIPTPWV